MNLGHEQAWKLKAYSPDYFKTAQKKGFTFELLSILLNC